MSWIVETITLALARFAVDYLVYYNKRNKRHRKIDQDTEEYRKVLNEVKSNSNLSVEEANKRLIEAARDHIYSNHSHG